MLIAVYNISKRYGDQLILDHISAEFHTGNIYCIAGENGSGKTVFLKCICGLISCSEGEIHIKGIPLRSENCLSGEIGAIIERPGFLPNYSGYENLYYLAALLHTPNKDQIRRAMYKVGLDPDSRKKVKHYSLGMKQRLGIAQAIMDNPAICGCWRPPRSARPGICISSRGSTWIRSIRSRRSLSSSAI